MSTPGRMFGWIIPLLLLLTVANGQTGQFSVRILQEDTVHTLARGQNQVTLEKKSFRLQLLLHLIRGAYLQASFKDSLYNLPDDQPVPGYFQLASMAMAEENYNKEKELIVSDEGWSYWFYDPSLDWHRFNKKIIFLDSGRVVGTKTVKNIFIPSRGNSFKLKEINRPLYLFFVAPLTEGADGSPGKELLRFRLKIEWKEED